MEHQGYFPHFEPIRLRLQSHICSSRSAGGFGKFGLDEELLHMMLRRHLLGGKAPARAPANIVECPFQILISEGVDVDRMESGIRPLVQSIAYHQGSANNIPACSSHLV